MNEIDYLTSKAVNYERSVAMKVGGSSWKQPWRVGCKVGRTIHVQLGNEPSDDDPLIGMMDTRRLAQEAVEAHNKNLEPKP